MPYARLAKIISSIDIGTVHNVNPKFTCNLSDDECTEGCYRPCDEFAIRLAQFYLTVNESRQDKLMTFTEFKKKDNDSFLFVLSFGGDAAPSCGMSFLLSFLNIGCRIASSAEFF